MSKAKFLCLFEATVFDGGELQLVVPPLKVEIFRGEREFVVFGRFTRVATALRTGNLQLGASVTLRTDPSRNYLALFSQRSFSKPDGVLEACYRDFDLAITKIAAAFGEDLFLNQIYRGPLLSGDFFGPLEMKVASRNLAFDAAALEAALVAAPRGAATAAELQSRLELISKFYVKALLFDNSEERFLMLWTVLEIFPMKDTSHVQPLREYLSTRTGRPLEAVEKCLSIGKLYGDRCKLVHDGRFPEGVGQQPLLEKLQRLVDDVVRYLCGKVYDGSLDEYFQSRR